MVSLLKAVDVGPREACGDVFSIDAHVGGGGGVCCERFAKKKKKVHAKLKIAHKGETENDETLQISSQGSE